MGRGRGQKAIRVITVGAAGLVAAIRYPVEQLLYKRLLQNPPHLTAPRGSCSVYGGGNAKNGKFLMTRIAHCCCGSLRAEATGEPLIEFHFCPDCGTSVF
jgi:hypothetical protein